eukprot:jgi/Ulvmu1/4233/UM191_0006.1
MAASVSQDAQGRIKALSDHIVNHIAAGEVVQRPAFALKELVENAIDAGATQLSIQVTDGGLKMLQIKDNGCGIHAEDFPILCRRHTTSKLSHHEDLKHISTLGFRGEALCSISFVSRLKIVSMRAGESMGYKAEFRDSEMTTAEPERCAAVQGTCITAEDMFYNVPNRRKALSSPSQEFRLMFDVIAKYAVFSTGVGFSLKRTGVTQPDVQTLPRHTRLDVIRSIFGATVKDHLVEFSQSLGWTEQHTQPPGAPGQEPCFSVQGLATNQNARCKKTNFLLFVNGRPVDCSALKSGLESIYAALHAKSSNFWAFLDVRMPTQHVDVNVHPTKSEVMFLHEQELVDLVRQAVEGALEECQGVRTLAKGSVSKAKKPSENGETVDSMPATEGTQPSTQRAKAGGDHKLVRTDHRAQSIKSALQQASESQRVSQRAALTGALKRRGHVGRGAVARSGGVLQELERSWMPAAGPAEAADTLKRAPFLKEALDAVTNHAHAALCQTIREHTFVGHVGNNSVLLQHKTALLLVNLAPLSKDLAYQQALLHFGAWRSGEAAVITVKDPPPVSELVEIALESRAERGELQGEDGDPAELKDMMLKLIKLHKQDLHEEFGVKLDDDLRLEALPALIPSYRPNLDALPEFFVSIAADVEWTKPSAKAVAVAEALAVLYTWNGMAHELVMKSSAEAQTAEPEAGSKEWMVENVILKAAKKHLRVPVARASDGTFVEVASLSQIYKVFERC